MTDSDCPQPDRLADYRACVRVLKEILGRRATSDGLTYCDRRELSNESSELADCEYNQWIEHLSRLIACPDPVVQSCIDASCAIYNHQVDHCEELYGS